VRGRGFIMTFTYMLTMYLNWTHPLHHFPSAPLPYFLEQFNKFHCSIFIHIYKVHWPYLLSFTLSIYPPCPIGTNDFLIVTRSHLTNPEMMINWTGPVTTRMHLSLGQFNNHAYLSQFFLCVNLKLLSLLWRWMKCLLCLFPWHNLDVIHLLSLLCIPLLILFGVLEWVARPDLSEPQGPGLWTRTLVTDVQSDSRFQEDILQSLSIILKCTFSPRRFFARIYPVEHWQKCENICVLDTLREISLKRYATNIS
jgi:hypothetical protein